MCKQMTTGRITRGRIFSWGKIYETGQLGVKHLAAAVMLVLLWTFCHIDHKRWLGSFQPSKLVPSSRGM